MTKTKIIVENNKRKVIITKREDGRFYIEFIYDGCHDFEWKKGSHGMFCDICDTLKSAKAKAKRYVNKEA